MQQCNLDRNDWPDRDERVLRLKYIGPLMDQQLQAAGIRTMQDLVDRTQQQTRAQNTRDWKQYFANAKPSQCMPPAKHYDAPWSGRKSQIPRDKRQHLKPGQYQYCVMSYNRCAWASAAFYLRNQPDVETRRVPYMDAPRDDWCENSNPQWCKERPQRRVRRRSVVSRRKSVKRKSSRRPQKQKRR